MEMRTRMLTKLTNHEVEQYLERNDLVFIPVGVIETHGGMPLDAETVIAEAVCTKLAEQADGLILGGLNYLYAGATMCGRGTIQVSIEAGKAYLEKIAMSLLRQGFRRQVYITWHGPSILTVGAMVRDFYEKTKVPILYLDCANLAIRWRGGEAIMKTKSDHDALFCAGYKIMGQLDAVPLNVPESPSQKYADNDRLGTFGSTDFMSELNARGTYSSAVGYYFGNAHEHGSTHRITSEEQRLEIATRGEALLDQVIERIDIVNLVRILREIDKFTQEELMTKFGDWMFDPYY